MRGEDDLLFQSAIVQIILVPHQERRHVSSMIVVDCTVVADFFIGDAGMQRSVQNLMEADSEWIAPVLWRYEFGHVLLKEVRAGRMSQVLMDQLLTAGEKLIVESVVDFDASAIAELSHTRNLSFYDASYVWLGQVRGLPFFTRNGKLARKCEGLAQPLPGE